MGCFPSLQDLSLSFLCTRAQNGLLCLTRSSVPACRFCNANTPDRSHAVSLRVPELSLKLPLLVLGKGSQHSQQNTAKGHRGIGLKLLQLCGQQVHFDLVGLRTTSRWYRRGGSPAVHWLLHGNRSFHAKKSTRECPTFLQHEKPVTVRDRYTRF